MTGPGGGAQFDFARQVALVTGAASGIGRATALALARSGARVTVVDRDEAGGRETVDLVAKAGSSAAFASVDVSRSDEVRDCVEDVLAREGRIDCFFNNAGIEGRLAPIHEVDEDVFDQVIAVNLKGAFLGLRHVLPVMVRQRSGTVVNTASIGGLAGAPNLAPYIASKHGVVGLTKSAAADVAPFGVRVNAVCPGPIETRMIRSIEAQRLALAPRGAAVGAARLGTPDDVAYVVLFLLSRLADNITGASFPTDGGRLAMPGPTFLAPG